MDRLQSITPGMEAHIDFTKAIPVDSMMAIYSDIEASRCNCGGRFFPTGPVRLKSPESTSKNIIYKLMIAACTQCDREEKRIYAVDTASPKYRKELSNAFESNPRWARLVSGNPIDVERIDD